VVAKQLASSSTSMFFCDPRAFEVTIFAPTAIGVLFSRMVRRHVLSDLD